MSQVKAIYKKLEDLINKDYDMNTIVTETGLTSIEVINILDMPEFENSAILLPTVFDSFIGTGYVADFRRKCEKLRESVRNG